MKLDVNTIDGKTSGSVDLADEVFGLEPRADILHRMVRYQLMKRMAGTHKTKQRSEVTGTGAKWFKQKGSGRARHGNKKPGLFRGGGKAFGPVVRSHAIKLPKKVRALALKHALSSKAGEEQLMVLDKAEIKEAKTKVLKGQLQGLGLENALIIGGENVNDDFARAARNIPHVDVLPVAGINVYDILRRDKLVLTKEAVEILEERLK